MAVLPFIAPQIQELNELERCVRSSETPSLLGLSRQSVFEISDGPGACATILPATLGRRARRKSMSRRLVRMATLKIKETFTTCGWNGTVQFPKTRNAIRDIDLHSTLARMLKEFVGSRTAGFLFQTKVERPLSQSDILNRDLHPILERAWVG